MRENFILLVNIKSSFSPSGVYVAYSSMKNFFFLIAAHYNIINGVWQQDSAIKVIE